MNIKVLMLAGSAGKAEMPAEFGKPIAMA